MIEARNLSIRAAGHAGRMLLRGVSLDLRAGEILAIVGPNGAGKSTLLRALAGELRPSSGTVTLAGRAAGDWPALDLARRRAVVSQRVALAFPMSAGEVAALGRLPWHGTPAAARAAEAVYASLARAGVAHLGGRAYGTLSGGEQQRVQVARALAQLDGAPGPVALLLDEPTSSLDAAHRAALLRSLRGLAERGAAVLAVLHDLNEAAFVADRVAILRDGGLLTTGTPDAVLRPTLMQDLYGTPFRSIPGGGLLPDFGAAL